MRLVLRFGLSRWKRLTSNGMAESVQIQVESLTVHNGMPMPQRFCFNGLRVDVTETLDQWHGPDYRYVRIKGDNGGLYILRFDEILAVWELTMFESERAQTLSALTPDFPK